MVESQRQGVKRLSWPTTQYLKVGEANCQDEARPNSCMVGAIYMRGGGRI